MSSANRFRAEAADRLEELVRAGIEEGLFPAAAFRVIVNGESAAEGAYGDPSPEVAGGAPCTLDTIFDLASVTKPLVATLLLQCVERGELHLGQRVLDWIPEAEDAPVGPVTLRQLASHVGGLPPWRPLYADAGKSALAQILECPLDNSPGTEYAYSDLGYILIGSILPKAAGLPLDSLARERLFEPLGMRDSGYRPPDSWRARCASTAHCGWRTGEILQGLVHDANAHSLGGIAGHAGLFSTVEDLTTFACALMAAEKEGADRGPLGPAAARVARTNQLDPKIGGHSIGWFTVPNGMLPSADLLSPACYGHSGFTGTLLMFDPEWELAIILLTNRVYAPGDGLGVLRLRRRFANVTAGGLR